MGAWLIFCILALAYCTVGLGAPGIDESPQRPIYRGLTSPYFIREF